MMELANSPGHHSGKTRSYVLGGFGNRNELPNRLPDVFTDCFGGQIVVVGSERVFDFFSNDFQTGQHVEDEDDKRNHEVVQAENVAQWERDAVNKNEFFQK